MERPLARGGPARTVVYAVCANGTSPGFEFYRDELNDTEKAQMLRLFNKIGESGRIANKEQFKRIEGTEFFEFKNFQIRMPCYFLAGRLVVITHGFRKKGDRIPPSEIDRATRIKQEDVARSQNRRES
jgi:phage-related protein